jgi:hypothetical protein
MPIEYVIETVPGEHRTIAEFSDDGALKLTREWWTPREAPQISSWEPRPAAAPWSMSADAVASLRRVVDERSGQHYVVRVAIKDTPTLFSGVMGWDEAVTFRSDILNDQGVMTEQASIINTLTGEVV